MSSEWIHTTLGEICHSQGGSIQTGPFGSQLHTSDYTECGTPVVMPTNIGHHGISDAGIARIGRDDVERLSQHRLEIGDIVFSRRGDVTKSALVTANEVGWLCGTGCLKVRTGIPKIASAKFLSYYLQLPETKDWLIRHAVGATMPNLNTGILSAVPITLPPLAIQAQISYFLSALDNRITLCTETNKTLEAIAQALFKSWFVDFDPVRAKMEGRQPEGMDEATAALFPDSFEKSEFGPIPRGWMVGKFSDVANLSKAGVNPCAHPEVTFQHFSLPAFDAEQMPVFELGSAIKSNKTVVPTGAVLLSKLNPHIPRIWLPSAIEEGAICSTEFLPLVPTEQTTTAFLYCLLSTHEFHSSLCQLVTGTSNSHQRIKPNNVLSLPAIVPPADVMKKFDSVTSVVLDSLKANRLRADTLRKLRDTLLPRLISGQLRLPEAEALVEEINP